MAEALNALLRWLHIASVVTLIGGTLYAVLVMTPAATLLTEESREALAERAAQLFRPLVYAAMAALVLSGLYNILTNPGHSPTYHMLLGVKLLLVAHVFAVSLLVVKPKAPRRARLMTGTMISGLLIILISAYLRKIF